MAEEKNNFIGGRMNKDLDERLMRNGEYRDARNVSVSNSETGNGGSLENVLGSYELSDFGLTDSTLEIIGVHADRERDRVFFFITNYTDSSFDQSSNFSPVGASHYIYVYDLIDESYSKLVQGRFLNFSKTHNIISVGTLESILYWTDNRNQPRKINTETAISNSAFIETSPYYTKEEHISVAKYYPWNPMRLYEFTGGLNTYGSDLLSSVTTTYPTITLTASTTYTFNIPDASDPESSTTSVSGTGAVIELITDSDSNIQSIKATTAGSGFEVGDTITLSDPDNGVGAEELVITLQEGDLEINRTMYDSISKVLPYSVTADPTGAYTAETDITLSVNTTGVDLDKFVGCLIYTEDSNGVESISISDGVYIVSEANTGGDSFDIVLSSAVDIADDDVIYIGANPYYDAEASPRRAELEDKFVKFSYRFKYDDNEYSLIAPFTQEIFIPSQDGFFLADEDDIDADEDKAFRSSILKFFKNKITKAIFQIELPEGISQAKDLVDELKVKEIDIIYSRSSESSLKVVDSITADDLRGDTSTKITYEYLSNEPTKVLPEREATRVFDRVPLKAKSQEIVGNRIMYGNIEAEQPYENNLDFEVQSGEKDYQKASFDAYNRVEYPTHTLKQNRTYQVGVVLCDKFGRQSDVITSDKSTIKSEYRDPSIEMLDTEDIYLGDSLKVIFNEQIPSESTIPNYRGLYDSSSNPLGWYSYKVVVKQAEQSYHTCYLPSILNGYPTGSAGLAAADLDDDTAHLVLLGDNINKIPRSLENYADSDNVYNSDSRIYPRVSSSSYSTNHNTIQIDPDLTEGDTTSIGTRDNLGLDKKEDGGDTGYDESPFFSIPTITEAGSNPFIARVSTNSALGAFGGVSSQATYISDEKQNLNIVETEPSRSNIDIYWETSTAGLISDLNSKVIEGEALLNNPTQVDVFSWTLSEDSAVNDYITNDFTVQDIYGNDILSSDTEAELISVSAKGEQILSNFVPKVDWTDQFGITKNVDNTFKMQWLGGKDLVYRDTSYFANNFDVVIRFSNIVDGVTVSKNIILKNNKLINKAPSVAEDETDFGTKENGVYFTRDEPVNNRVTTPRYTCETGWRKIGDITGVNGSIYNSSSQIKYKINSVQYFNNSDGEYVVYDVPSGKNSPGAPPAGSTSVNFNIAEGSTRVDRNGNSPSLYPRIGIESLVRIVEFNGQLSLWYSPLLQSLSPNTPNPYFALSGEVNRGLFSYGINDNTQFSYVDASNTNLGIEQTSASSRNRSVNVWRYTSGVSATKFRVNFSILDANGSGLTSSVYYDFTLNTNNQIFI